MPKLATVLEISAKVANGVRYIIISSNLNKYSLSLFINSNSFSLFGTKEPTIPNKNAKTIIPNTLGEIKISFKFLGIQLTKILFISKLVVVPFQVSSINVKLKSVN